jgi:type IV secretion system protein VirB10
MTNGTNVPSERNPEPRADPEPDGNSITPLPGEPGIPNVADRQRISMSKKGLLAVSLLIASLVAMAALTIQRVSAGGKKGDEVASKLVRDKPTAATGEPRKLEMPPAPTPPPTASAALATSPRIPALTPTADELAEPKGVRRTGSGAPASGAPASGGPKVVPPEDAPVLLVSTRPSALLPPSAASRRTDAQAPTAEGMPPPEPEDSNDAIAATTRNLQGYQRQLQGLLDNLTKTTALAAGHATGQNAGQNTGPMPSGALIGGHPMAGPPPVSGPPAGGGLFGGQLQGSSTPKVAAHLQGNRSLTLPKGTAFTCALKTKVISATSGLVGCQVQRNVFSDDGRVLLIERGSHLDGEYRIASMRPGTVRIPVLWTRIRTPLGVTVDLDSPGTGPLGESGVDGHVDNRWGERIGAAMLLSLIDDSVKLLIQSNANDHQASTIVLPSTTANASKLAEKVLDSTINMPPLIYQNQGGIVGIYVARDVDFSSVYELRPTANETPREAAR